MPNDSGIGDLTSQLLPSRDGCVNIRDPYTRYKTKQAPNKKIHPVSIQAPRQTFQLSTDSLSRTCAQERPLQKQTIFPAGNFETTYDNDSFCELAATHIPPRFWWLIFGRTRTLFSTEPHTAFCSPLGCSGLGPLWNYLQSPFNEFIQK